jgi:rubrerythrin
MFGYATKAEKVHATLYQQALDLLLSGSDLTRVELYLCPVCGNIELGKPTEKCFICGLPAERYQKVG